MLSQCKHETGPSENIFGRGVAHWSARRSITTLEQDRFTMQHHLYPFVPRRREREITEAQHLRALLHAALVGRMGVIAQGEPYIVPMNFAYEQLEGTLGKIILHGAGQGRLFQALEGTPVVCFEIDAFIETLPHPVLCEYDTAYTSVICWGQVHQVMTVEERTVALRLLARKYATVEKAEALKERTVERFRSDMDAQTSVYEILLERMTGKQQLRPTSS